MVYNKNYPGRSEVFEFWVALTTLLITAASMVLASPAISNSIILPSSVSPIDGSGNGINFSPSNQSTIPDFPDSREIGVKFKELLFSALDVRLSQIDPDPQKRGSDAVPPLMLSLYGLENYELPAERILMDQLQNLTGDDSNQTTSVGQGTDLAQGPNSTGKFYDSFKASRLHSIITSSIETFGDASKSMINSYDIHDNITSLSLDSVIASKPIHISGTSSNISIRYHIKGHQLKNLVWVELVLHRKLKIRDLEQFNHFKTRVCTSLQEPYTANTTISCSTQAVSFVSTDDFIHVQIEQEMKTNYSQHAEIVVNLNIEGLWDIKSSFTLMELYEFETASKYSPFLLIYTERNDTSSRKNVLAVNRVRVKRRTSQTKTVMCQLHEWYIDFSTLGWDDWFIKPNGYYINFCGGTCTSPLLNEIYNASMHALIKDLWILATGGNSSLPTNKNGLMSNVPKASCVPIEYESLSVLYIEDSNIVLKHLDSMSASRCGCR